MLNSLPLKWSTNARYVTILLRTFLKCFRMPPDAPWHVHFRRRLQKSLLVSPKHPITRSVLKSKKAIEKESRRQVKHYPGFIIHPLSEFRMYWNIYIFFLMLLHQTLTPFAVGFVLDMQGSALDYLVILDFVMCLILFVELMLIFRTGYIIKETNEIILDPKIFLKDFIPDLISCVPFIYLTTFLAQENRDRTINFETVILMFCLFIFSFLRFNRILLYFLTVSSMLTEKGTIIFSLCLRSLYL